MRSLAKAALKTYPEVFADEEAARDCIRQLAGKHGDRSRKRGALPVRPAKGYVVPLPESRAKPWEPHNLSAKRTLILSDVHVPFHDTEALSGALDWGAKWKPDCILLNGDTADFYTISRYESDPRQRDLAGEVRAVRTFLAHLRSRFRNARIVYKLGNHDERWMAYLYRKAPELLGLDIADFTSIIEADKHGVEIVQDQRIIQLGKLSILHGHELPKGMPNPVNPARGVFLRAIDIALIGHQHRTSEHTETTMMGRTITCWSTGCLCELHPEYARINRWNHGFAAVECAADGMFRVQNLRMRHGEVL